ncbi:hypothetical protein [Mycobacteroides abscessus]|nr:hypothetical protein [Mycobacteroides abscessus]SIF35287.1 Uncharacterised protein [Mycobacteroides abscessus subsp. abscessus]
MTTPSDREPTDEELITALAAADLHLAELEARTADTTEPKD